MPKRRGLQSCGENKNINLLWCLLIIWDLILAKGCICWPNSCCKSPPASQPLTFHAATSISLPVGKCTAPAGAPAHVSMMTRGRVPGSLYTAVFFAGRLPPLVSESFADWTAWKHGSEYKDFKRLLYDLRWQAVLVWHFLLIALVKLWEPNGGNVTQLSPDCRLGDVIPPGHACLPRTGF